MSGAIESIGFSFLGKLQMFKLQVLMFVYPSVSKLRFYEYCHSCFKQVPVPFWLSTKLPVLVAQLLYYQLCVSICPLARIARREVWFSRLLPKIDGWFSLWILWATSKQLTWYLRLSLSLSLSHYYKALQLTLSVCS